MKKTLMAGLLASSFTFSNSHAAIINLVDTGGVTGSKAEQGFNIAAGYWEKLLTNDTVINLEVGFGALPPGVIGSTGSTKLIVPVLDWEILVGQTKSNSFIDQNIVLPNLYNDFGVLALSTGVDANGIHQLNEVEILDGTQVASQSLAMNSSLLKGLLEVDVPSLNDGSVIFNSEFNFDFNPSNGIKNDAYDFISVAIHEIGHALGFVSGVDIFDFFTGPSGPGAGDINDLNLNTETIFSALDMFRYSQPGFLDLRINAPTYFSIDGGQTALFGNAMSTGRFNGDGDQASHWKDLGGCSDQLGILDPNSCFGQMGEVTGLDLAAYDAMGWNLSEDALTYGYKTTAQIYAEAVPEPAIWTLLLGALGFIGATKRKKD